MNLFPTKSLISILSTVLVVVIIIMMMVFLYNNYARQVQDLLITN